MRKSLLSLLVTASTLLVSGSAFASHHKADNGMAPGWYFGAGVNRSSLQTMDVSTSVNSADATTVQMDSRDYGWSLIAGKNVTDFLAVQAQYAQYGNNTVNSDSDSLAVDVTDTYSLGLMGVMKTPSWQGLSFVAEVGAAYLSEKTDTSVVAATTIDESTTYDGVGLTYGIGVQYDYSQFGVRFDWQAIQVSDSDYVNDYVLAPETYTLSLIYNFV